MGKLYIFGNGLDLHYGLKTSPNDYLQFLKQERIYNETSNAAEIFLNYNVNWSDFEQEIAYIDLEQIEENQAAYPDYMSDHESDREGVITNIQEYVNSMEAAINNALTKMIQAAEYEINNFQLDSQWSFGEKDMILSFNYTSTIEKVSDVMDDIPILHIHGAYNDKDMLILGYDKPLNNYNYKKYSNSEDGDYYMEQQLDAIHDFYLSLQKKLQFDRLKNFLGLSGQIDEVIVYGHSLGAVDAPYLEKIDQLLNPVEWKISYFKKDAEVFYNAEKLSFKNKISFFQW